MTSLNDNDIVQLFEKRAYDACACTPDRVKIFYNKKQLCYKSFEKYIDLYIGSKSDKKTDTLRKVKTIVGRFV